MSILIFIATLFLLYCAISTLYLLLFAIAGVLDKQKFIPFKQNTYPHKLAVLIPAYKEDEVIIEVARQSLLQSYPAHLYDVIIISDSLLERTLEELSALPIQVIRVQFEKSTKAKAINAALNQLPNYDIAVVLDADNVMDYYFLEKAAQAFTNGYRVIQGHRMAKNTNTSIAVMDAISEEINNHIFRKGHCALGLSSALIGSAMAFDYTYFKDKMEGIDAISGFDKELELAILKDGTYIHYAEEAIVYDEKVQQLADFRNQRTRWIAAQVMYLCTYLPAAVVLLCKGNINYFDKVLQFLLPPRVILLGLLSISTLLTGLCQMLLLFKMNLLIICLLVFALLISVPRPLLSKLSWKEFYQLPALFFNFLLSCMHIKKARYTFIHTPHRKVE